MRILCVFGKHAYGDPARGEGYEHANFLPALRALGHDVALFESFDRRPYHDFADMNRTFVKAVEIYRPQLIFAVLMGYEIWSETLDWVRARFGVQVLNWGTDDSWKYEQFGRFVARHVDVYCTTSADALHTAKCDGSANVVLSQWAASDLTLAEPLPATRCQYPVSFIGAAYGNRQHWIRALSGAGIDIRCFGHGWPDGPVDVTEIPRIMRESVVSLNFGDSGLHLKGLRFYRSRQIKARVFEVPGAGGFLLTQRAQDLDRYYRSGHEIATFESEKELVQKVQYYLDHVEERDRIAQAGHMRTRNEHTYTARFKELFAQLPHVREPDDHLAQKAMFQVDCAEFEHLAKKHKTGVWLGLLRNLIVWPLSFVWGRERGARAARRLLYELSWRLFGARTFSATGLPGRMFYNES